MVKTAVTETRSLRRACAHETTTVAPYSRLTEFLQCQRQDIHTADAGVFHTETVSMLSKRLKIKSSSKSKVEST